MKNKWKIWLVLTLLFAFLVNMAACGKANTDDLTKNIEKNDVTGKSADERFLDSQYTFAAELFRRSAEESRCENTLISPLSVMAALAMTANGANGETRTQMEKVLGGTLSIEELNEYLYHYIQKLPSSEDYKLHLANAIWARKNSLEVKKEFLQTTADYYGAAFYEAPFDQMTLREINDWVSENTDGMIDSILSELPDDLMMVLINALCFDAAWAKAYPESAVRDATFNALSGKEQTVKMMYSSEDYYLSDKNTTGFIKNYADGKYQFVALLPEENEDFEEYVASLTGEKLKALLASKEKWPVTAALPKFEYEYELSLANILQGMGITKAFIGGKADLSGIGVPKAGELFIGDVLHKTFISVGEERTKAAAVTVIETLTTSAELNPKQPKTVILDRPFVYIIIETETNLPIFLGTVTEITP